MCTSEDLVAYAENLAEGNALTVRRLGQYADYDVSVLAVAVSRARDSRIYYESLSDQRAWASAVRRWKGVHQALIMALGDAQDRAYQNRATA